MNNSDQSQDLMFLFDEEKSLRSVLSKVFILEFPNRKRAKKNSSSVSTCFF